MNVKKQVDYWLKSARGDFETAEVLFENAKFHHSLLFCHLTLEKGLKAIVVIHTKEIPPRSHNLLYLAELAGLSVDPDDEDFLLRMNGYQLEARYPDEKFRIYKKTTKAVTQDLLSKTKGIRIA